MKLCPADKQLGAPIEIREQINMDSASRDFYEKLIRTNIDDERKVFFKSNERTNFLQTKKFIKDIEQLSHMSQGLPLAVVLAFHLCESTFKKISLDNGDAGDACILFDHLAYNLCRRMKTENQDFDPQFYLKHVEGNRNWWLGNNSERPVLYMLHCRDFLESWVRGSSSVQKFYEDILNNLRRYYQNMVDRLDTQLHDYHASLLISHILKVTIPNVERLSYMVGGQKLALDLLLFAGRHSYLNYTGIPCGRQVSKKFDKAADSLLLRILKDIREGNPNFRPVDAMEEILDEIETTDYSEYFSQSLKLLSSWMPDVEKAHARQYSEGLRARISHAHAAANRRLVTCLKDGTFPTTDILGKMMCGFIDEVAQLSEKLGGLLPAIEMVVVLGESSYTKKEGLGPLYGWDINAKFQCKREFDRRGDALLRTLLDKAKAEHRQVDERIGERIKTSIEYLKPYGITTYFPSSYDFISHSLG